ncbi:MAG TPA: hypothetical protein VF635_04835 [Propionibacteriaceae bacterium]|jgi:hypothetical protein
MARSRARIQPNPPGGAYDSPSSIGFAPSVFVDITGYLDKELDV